MSDRQVYAVSKTGLSEVVRYDRSGKWYVESDVARYRVRLADAVAQAARWKRMGGDVFLDKPGGQRFDHAYRKANA